MFIVDLYFFIVCVVSIYLRRGEQGRYIAVYVPVTVNTNSFTCSYVFLFI